MTAGPSILVLGLRGFPGVQGGIEAHAQHLYPELCRLGCAVEVVTRSPYAGGRRSWQGVRLRPLWAPRQKYLETLVHTFLGVCYAGLRRPDLLHVHAVGAGLWVPLARLLGLRVVLTHHGRDYEREKWGPVARGVLRLGERLGCRLAHAVITVNEELREHLQERYGVGATCIYNGVQRPDGEVDSNVLKRLDLERGRYALSVGRIVPEKRYEDLIRAFAGAGPADWKLVIAGTHDYPGRYERQLGALAARDPRVVLAGFQPAGALRALYEAAGVFVLASSHEGHPLALLEALSFDLPVLATAIPGNVETGLPAACLFPPGDTARLTELLAGVVRDPDGNRVPDVHALLERYQWPRIAVQTLEVYRRAGG